MKTILYQMMKNNKTILNILYKMKVKLYKIFKILLKKITIFNLVLFFFLRIETSKLIKMIKKIINNMKKIKINNKKIYC